jgi:LuxR family maltose regulon positive regulatory protein
LCQNGEEHNLPLTLGWAHYLLGRVAYEWDDLPGANEHFATVIQLREHAHFKALREATLSLALTAHVMGDPPRAHQTVDELQRFADAVPAQDFGAIIQAFKARLLLLDGDGRGAAQRLSTVDLSVLLYPSVLEIELPHLTEAQGLATLGSAAALRQALDKLDDLVRWHTVRGEACCTLRALAVKALVLESQHKTADALAVLRQAIALAAPGRFVRSFVDLGEPMRELLLRLYPHDATTGYVSFLLSRFPGTSEIPAPRRHLDAVPIEALTARETEILDLLVRRSSNKEIAERLVISDNTVKRHTVSLYQKLRVTGRQAAVARAVSLGLVSTK